MRSLRVAYFPDSFHEVNGVAHTSRNFVAYARRKELPFLCVRAGGRGEALVKDGAEWTLELGRSRASVPVEKDLEFDVLFWRHAAAIERAVREFKPDVIHITGPSELGFFGAYFAWKLGVPLAASWHTNVHEYLARRMAHLPGGRVAERAIERGTLQVATAFYARAEVLFAPNTELCGMLAEGMGRPCHLMQRGVDTELFSPARRSRRHGGQTLRLGYVGRLSVEKNVRLLVQVERELAAAGSKRRELPWFEFFIVGQGGDEAMLRRELPGAHFAGVLRGEVLATACADMDLLVFPSHTDTFGNVVLEALASGVPAIVTPDGGPKFIVEDGVTGFVTDDDAFGRTILALAGDRERLRSMGVAARRYALTCSWDAVFEAVYAGYEVAVAEQQ